MTAPSEIAGRLAALRERIASACARSGRDPSSVALVGASKFQPVELLRAACEAGLAALGENRVQEAQEKARVLPAGIEWHLLGPLQSNKARAAVELFQVIHSIDRPKIAHALAAEAAGQGRELLGLLEVNLGREPSKHGFDPERLLEEARPLAALPHLRLVGLMAIPPYDPDPAASRPWFAQLRALRDRLAAQSEWKGFAGWLSMGMSEDFEVAIEEGATHVRIGTALFGPRRSAT